MHSSRIGFLFLLALVLPLVVSAQQSPILPSMFLPGDEEVSQAAGDQLSPSIAQGGNQSLAVWVDKRTVLGAPGTGSDIYGIRLDADGNAIDSLPFVITQGPGDDLNSQVVWNGTNWLVIWETWGENGTGYYYAKHIMAARVSPAGTVLDTKPILVYAPGNSSGIMFAAASDGTDWAVVFQGTSSGENDIRGVRISDQGSVIDVPSILVLPAEYYLRFNLSLAYSSGTYLLAWTDLNDMQGLRMGSDLHPIDGNKITLASGIQSFPKLAGNNTGFFLLYGAEQWDYTSSIIGKRITAAGVILDPAGIDISQANHPNTYGPGYFLTWNGNYWIAGWSFDGMSIARINTSGVVLDPGGVALPTLISGPLAPRSSGGIQVVWEAVTQNPYLLDIAAGAISPNLTAGPVNPISLSAPSQTFADVVYNGNGWMVLYRSATSTQLRILAQLLDSDGAPLSAEPIELANTNPAAVLSSPAIAWNGSVYLATWYNQSAGGIQARRIQSDGTPLDPSPIFVMPGWSPDVEALADNFLVVGVNSTNPHYVFPFVRRVRGSDGALLDANPIMIGGSFSSAPSVAVVGDRWLAVWQRNFSHDDPHAELNGAFINADGTSPGDFIVSGLVDGNYYGPHIASKNDSALIVWEDERVSNYETEVVGRRILSDGTLQAGITITTKRGNQFLTNVAWDGNQYIVVYHDQRNHISDLSAIDETADLFGTRLDALGNVIDSSGFIFASATSALAFPVVAAGNGKTFFAASIFRSDSTNASYRIGYFLKGTNQWPVANVDANVTSGDVPATIVFSSNGSYDPDGSIASYSWDFDDGTTSSEPNPTHTYQIAGDFVVTLTVTDDSGETSHNSIFLKIQFPNQPPIAVASANPTDGTAPLDVVFSASGSYDPDGSIGNIHWDFGDGWEYWGSPAYHTFEQDGVYNVVLTVYDNRGATGTDTITITVGGDSNQPPVAAATATPDNGVAPLTVSFSSAGCYDPDGTIVSYSWTFGDGTSSTAPNPNHIYTAAGVYQAALVVTDNDGAQSSKTLTITVTQALCTSCLHSDHIELSYFIYTKVKVIGKVTVKNENGVKIPGAIVFVTWTKSDGTSVNKDKLTKGNGTAKTNVKGGHGTYTLTVTNIVLQGYTFDPTNGTVSQSITIP